MSRSDYTDDCENLAMWRGAVESAIRGKRGQRLLQELAAAMDAMPIKELIADELEADGAYCALGVVGARRGVDMSALDPEDPEAVSAAFNIAPALAREVVYINDEGHESSRYVNGHYEYACETPAARWIRVRKWVAAQIISKPAA